MAVQAAPGAVLAVWTSASLTSDLIRVGEALEGEPAVANHVVVVTHQDVKGRWLGIQGRPGGVGLVDCTPFLASPRTRGNYEQVVAMASRAGSSEWLVEVSAFLASCAKSVGVGYDWVGIAEDFANSLRLRDLSAALDHVYRWPASHGQLPGDVVCSSLAAWQYDTAGWPHPALGRERTCTPADWWDWSDQRLWAPLV